MNLGSTPQRIESDASSLTQLNLVLYFTLLSWKLLRKPLRIVKARVGYVYSSLLEPSHGLNDNLMALQTALVAYFTAGYPTPAEAVDIMLGLEAAGAGA